MMQKTNQVQIATISQPMARSHRARGWSSSSSGTRARAGAAGAVRVTVSVSIVGAATGTKDARPRRSDGLTLCPDGPRTRLVPGSSEFQHLVQREDARVVLPRVRLALRTTVEHDLAARNAHTDRDEHRFRTSCAYQHSVPP